MHACAGAAKCWKEGASLEIKPSAASCSDPAVKEGWGLVVKGSYSIGPRAGTFVAQGPTQTLALLPMDSSRW